MKPVALADLNAGGELASLLQLFGGIRSGRLVIVGQPGAGKTGTAILLLLDVLKYRNSMQTANEQSRVPLPVLFTLSGRSPAAERSADDWLVDEPVRGYPRLFGQPDGREEAASLVRAGKVAAIVDGLDDVPKQERAPTLKRLDGARFRVVLLTRTKEMRAVTRKQFLIAAVTIMLLKSM